MPPDGVLADHGAGERARRAAGQADHREHDAEQDERARDHAVVLHPRAQAASHPAIPAHGCGRAVVRRMYAGMIPMPDAVAAATAVMVVA